MSGAVIGRVILGAWMLLNGINHFFLHAWTEPTGNEPLAVQLMTAFVHSHLFDVAMAIELVAGALILTGFFVPVALCVLMPVSTCAVFWAVILDHQPLEAVLSLVAFVLNGLLMVACIEYYRDALRRYAPAYGEARGARA
jgi:uncharacterized membrane protein YphA (DoxX/SURF4 family)